MLGLVAVLAVVVVSVVYWSKHPGLARPMTAPSSISDPSHGFVPCEFDTTTGLVTLRIQLSNQIVPVAISTSSPTTIIGTVRCPSCIDAPFNPDASGTFTRPGVTEQLTLANNVKVLGEAARDTLTLRITLDATCDPGRTTQQRLYRVPDFAFFTVDSSSLNTLGMASSSPVLDSLPAANMMWGVALKHFGSSLWLGGLPPCLTRAGASPLLPSLPDATTALLRAPGRFYAVGVTGVTVLHSDGTETAVARHPTVAVVTLGQPRVELPPGSLADMMAATSSRNTQGLRIHFSAGHSHTIPRGRCLWSPGGTGSDPIYAVMATGDATALSATQSVMLLGSLAFQYTALGFDLRSGEFLTAALTVPR